MKLARSEAYMRTSPVPVHDNYFPMKLKKQFVSTSYHVYKYLYVPYKQSDTKEIHSPKVMPIYENLGLVL